MSGPRRSSESESTQRQNALILSAWRPLLLLTVFAFLVLYDDWVFTPSCKIVPSSTGADPTGQFDVGESQNPDDLRVMIVANLLLLGSEAGFFNLYFRDYYMSKFFRKSFDSLRPDMLLVLGDVSARGSELTKTGWVSVLYQFHRVLGPFLQLPYHVVLGDRDVGQCSGLNTNSVHWIARNFPGLDSAGCGAFEISNVSFVSLNAVALLCGNNKLRFSVERVIETESIHMKMDLDGAKEGTGDYEEMGDDSEKIKIGFEGTSTSFQWRKNVIESGSGPALLLHFPLHRWPTNNGCQEIDISKKAANPWQQGSEALVNWRFTNTGPYELLHTVPPNATEYIFQALKPRLFNTVKSQIQSCLIFFSCIYCPCVPNLLSL
uniref:Calcineurin-like phosphoesterase domain-containing protein n=1 Tax=Rhizophora mucronata TaxID=61149 RepID=A0A2P2LPH0_RHIMU